MVVVMLEASARWKGLGQVWLVDRACDAPPEPPAMQIHAHLAHAARPLTSERGGLSDSVGYLTALHSERA